MDGFLPLRPCVAWQFEGSHDLSASSYIRDPNTILSQEFGIASSMLEAQYIQARAATTAQSIATPEKEWDHVDIMNDYAYNHVWIFELELPIRWFLNIIMKCGSRGVMFNTPKKGNLREFLDVSFKRLDLSYSGNQKPNFIVIFERHSAKSWRVRHAGQWCPGHNCSSHVTHKSWYCVMWGVHRSAKRQVIEVFSSKWMLYDKSGLYETARTLDKMSKGREVRSTALASGRPVPGLTAAAREYAVGMSVCTVEFDDRIAEEEGLIWYDKRNEKLRPHK